MKKTIALVAAGYLFVACTNDNVQNSDPSALANSKEASGEVGRFCPSEEIRQNALNTNAELMRRFQQNEINFQDFETKLKLGKVLADGTVEIPVIVNVIYKSNAENVSDARIAEQIETLNEDFGGTNADAMKIPNEFQTVAAGDTKVKFRLEQVNRKKTSKTSWATNDAMKKTSQGGLDATNPTNYLNLWVVGKMTSQGRTILGYATFPESAGLWNDGVVIAAPFFGSTGASAPFNLGRTATHEVGHYLNLRHIWGDVTCGNDQVNDTPTQQTANYGKPNYPLYQTCSGTSRSVMFMNYMDYVDDGSMYMFSQGQKTRINATTASSGPRAGLRLL